MTKDFSQVMSERTDRQLVDIVTTKREEYQPEALIAAENELTARQIDPATFYSGEERASISKANVVYKEDMPLERMQIIFTILLPAIFIAAWTLLFHALEGLKVFRLLGFPAIVFMYYSINKWLKNNGYQKKAKEFMKWTTYTLFIYIGLILVLGLSAYFLAGRCGT